MKLASKTSRTVRAIGEFGLIQKLCANLPHTGDDCAVLPGGLLLTCDPVIEGVHFLKTTPPRQVGWKAMARNLSDIAAMGGLPKWAVVSLGLRPGTTVRYVQQLYAGMNAVAGKFGCQIVGGDTAHVRGEQFVVVTLVGQADRPILRSGAKVGDIVFVTGRLGGSFRSGKHLTFTPRIREGRQLARYAHAMMDISDGLASDLHRLVESSHVGFDIDSTKIPVAAGVAAALRAAPSANTTRQSDDTPRGARLTGAESDDTPRGARLTETWLHRQTWLHRAAKARLHHALTDGEDFELLFTVPPRAAGKLRKRFHEIGRVIKKPVVLLDGKPLHAQGYDHFQKRR